MSRDFRQVVEMAPLAFLVRGQVAVTGRSVTITKLDARFRNGNQPTNGILHSSWRVD
jgi:hypothetical protein